MLDGTSRGGGQGPKPNSGLEWLSPQAGLPVIRKHWKLLLFVTTVIVVLAIVALMIISPNYTSQMTLLVETKQNPVIGIGEGTMVDKPQDAATAAVGEIQLILSRNLAKRIVDELDLDSDPEFAGEQQSREGAFRTIWIALKTLLVPMESTEDGIIDRFLDGLRVSQIAGSPAILVSYSSGDAQKSAKILNSMAQNFLRSRLEDQLENAVGMNEWLAQHIGEMRAKVEHAERNIADYRAAHGLIDGERTAQINEQISRLTTEQADAVAARQTAEAKLRQAKLILQRPESASAFYRDVGSELIQKLREDQVKLEQRVAELGNTLGKRHPRMMEIQEERNSLASALRLEIARLAETFEYDVRVTREREQGVNQRLEEAKKAFGSLDRASVELRALEREGESNRLTLERFMNLVPQISAHGDMQTPGTTIRVVSNPTVEPNPSFPKPIPFLAISLLTGLGVGLLGAMFAEYIENRTFVSGEEIEAATSLPVLGQVPLVRARRADVSQQVLERGYSLFAEAVSSLYTRQIMIHGTDRGVLSDRAEIKSVAFTSCEPGEGKSTVALALARQLAHNGRRIIIVDADFARSQLAGFAGISDSTDVPGLAEVLLGRAAIHEVIKRDVRSPLHIILPGSAAMDHSALAGSPVIANFISELRANYDLVVIDTQPVMATAHAYLFASAADLSLMVIRWRRTSRSVVLYALHQLRLLGCNVNAVVLSMVDVNRMRYYGYGDSHLYNGRATEYYRRATGRVRRGAEV